MQNAYLDIRHELYTAEEQRQVRYYLDGVVYKYHLANLSLEQLWSMSESKRDGLYRALENSLDRLDVSDDELLLISFVLESFLYHARSFLDFYMIYICVFLKTNHQGSMTLSRFYSALERVDGFPFGEKAQRVHDYFESKVFGDCSSVGLGLANWGTLLQSLRDKIAHRDRIRPSFDSEETLLSSVLFDWPTLRHITYDRFCQYVQNGMFALFTDMSPVLYELEWKPGPWKPDLWQ